ncbi:RagB/SusD family nutrient uptake outer membrane protein [Bacteroides salyersiae]|nr:RagB/SusD family nutrient uptake outer membrane protein [Bacteroides salyersiae]
MYRWTTKRKAEYKAEARFLRALSYYNLSQLFGDVPIVDKQLNSEAEVLKYGRRPIAEVYDFIVKDLKFVTQSQLPDNWGFDGSNPNFGRASKTAGYALLGKVYLTMAKRLNNGATQDYLQPAKEALDAAYSARPFGELKDIAYGKVFGVANITCNEIIFQVMYLQGTDEGSYFAKNFQPLSATGIISQSQGLGDNIPENDLIQEYETGDMRKVVSYKTYGTTPYVNKYVDLGDSQGRGGSCWIVLRYADVILMLAEVNEALGLEPEAITYIDMIRTRAKLKSYEQAPESYKNDYPTIKDVILHERRIELAFENHRWFDLLRFYKPDDLVKFLNDKSVQGCSKRDLLLPIPWREVSINPSGMYQNDGY